MTKATILLDELLEQVRKADTHEDARAIAWTLHGAARMACRLGKIDLRTWDDYEEAVSILLKNRIAEQRQPSLLDD